MTAPTVLAIAVFGAGTAVTAAQTGPAASQLLAVTHTAYSPRTELFAEWRPLIVGEATRLTAHLTRTGERFTPYGDGKVSLMLTVEGVASNAAADGPERPGVFRLNVTPTKSGAGRIVIDVTTTTGTEHFVIDNVPVYTDADTALARQAAPESGLVSYAKERSWEEEFATAQVTGRFQGAARILIVPLTAVVRDGATAHVYLQRTPERFAWREVTTRRTIGDAIEITGGLRDGDRIVVRGTDRMPRKQP